MLFYKPTILIATILLAMHLCQAVSASGKPSATSEQTPFKPLSNEAVTLFDAAENGDTPRVKALLDKGMSAKVQAPNGLTPLIMAAMMNHPDTVRLLLDRGADVNAVLNSEGYTGKETALNIAADGSMNILAGAKVPPSPPGYAGHEIQFMKKRLDLMQKWERQTETWAKGYGVIVRMLLDHGADVNAQTRNGDTAIDGAAASGGLAEVQLLLERGARLDLPTHQKDLLDGRSIDGTNGYDALVEATSMYQHQPKVVSLLLEHGANPNAKSTNDLTPLGRASESGDAEVVGMLLKAGADVNAYDGFGRTALMLARGSKHAAVVSLLQQAGAKDIAEGPHTDVTLQKLGHEPNGDTRMQVIVTPRPGSGPVSKKVMTIPKQH